MITLSMVLFAGIVAGCLLAGGALGALAIGRAAAGRAQELRGRIAIQQIQAEHCRRYHPPVHTPDPDMSVGVGIYPPRTYKPRSRRKDHL